MQDALARVHPTLGESARFEKELNRSLKQVRKQAAKAAAAPTVDPNELQRLKQSEADLSTQLQSLHAESARAPGPSDVQDPRDALVVKDGIAVTSVALRLTLEAISLSTVIALEAAELSSKPKSWLKGAPDSAHLAKELPSKARHLYHSLQASRDSLKSLLARLSDLDEVDPLDAVGYAYKDGLVDDVVGLAWDSVHLDLHAGGEALFYSALADEEFSSEGGNTYDYSGRQTQLEYDIEPIVLASAQLAMKLDWPHWADAAKLDVGYSTNRVYKSGGDLGSGSLANELGVKNSLSDALEAALAIAGVRTAVRLAHFNHGRVRNILIADGSTLAEAPLTFDLTQIDVGYDLAAGGGPVVQTLSVGFRYFDYELPRVLYELENETPDEETAAYVFSRETPAQAMRTRYYMAALTARIEKRVTPHWFPYLSMDVAAGYGPTSYYFLRNEEAANRPSNREHTSSSGVGIGLAGALGIRWQVGGPDARLNAYFDANYHAQSLNSLADSSASGDTIVDVGITDLFHGPTASLGATF
jgi:FtsZ-binding cell division protein ZapB